MRNNRDDPVGRRARIIFDADGTRPKHVLRRTIGAADAAAEEERADGRAGRGGGGGGWTAAAVAAHRFHE